MMICKICKKSFRASRKTRKYCSHRCFGISIKGRIPWDKGIERPPFSKEWLLNMSKAQKIVKKKPFTKEHRKNIGLASKGRIHSKETKNKISNALSYKRIDKINHHGYIYIYKPKHPFCSKQKYVAEHRLVMEKHLKRFLTPKEVVHHINGIKDDNRLENLMLFSSIIKHAVHHDKLRSRTEQGKLI